ncbi:MAG: zinc ribbon domain-containing protein, partial [Chloroflexi bacterium]|nr:zinc ribbon domain-containing protein [Chloroflexota bacterium]
MIHCPACNTTNRDGSKFCNECGTNLQSASLLRCSPCGDLNGALRTECANCGAPLVVQGDEQAAALPDEPTPLDRAHSRQPTNGDVPAHLDAHADSTSDSPSDLSDWLRLVRDPAAPPNSVSGTSGLLDGIDDALPVEDVFAKPHEVTRTHMRIAAVPVTGFTEFFAPQPPPPPMLLQRQVRTSRSRFSGRGLLVVLILAFAALPFLPIFADVRGANLSVHQPALDFYQTIEALRPNQLIMVALDYTGGARAELDPQARAALLHLLQNKQRIVALSFVPEGGQLAQDLLNDLNPLSTSFAYPYSYGDTHVNLGFQSSGDAALRSLAQSALQLPPTDFTGKPTSSWAITKDLKSMGDVALVIVFGDDGAAVRRWV